MKLNRMREEMINSFIDCLKEKIQSHGIGGGAVNVPLMQLRIQNIMEQMRYG